MPGGRYGVAVAVAEEAESRQGTRKTSVAPALVSVRRPTSSVGAAPSVRPAVAPVEQATTLPQTHTAGVRGAAARAPTLAEPVALAALAALEAVAVAVVPVGSPMAAQAATAATGMPSM